MPVLLRMFQIIKTSLECLQWIRDIAYEMSKLNCARKIILFLRVLGLFWIRFENDDLFHIFGACNGCAILVCNIIVVLRIPVLIAACNFIAVICLSPVRIRTLMLTSHKSMLTNCQKSFLQLTLVSTNECFYLYVL